jgi:lycopene cyclase domain-containing protein
LTIRQIHVPAFLISFGLNLRLYLFYEYNAIMRGHWVYNEQRLLGWRVAETIPIEEIGLYCTSFLFLVPFFETARRLLIRFFGTAQERQEMGQPEAASLKDIREFVEKRTDNR